MRELNGELFEKVAGAIEEQPWRYEQRGWETFWPVEPEKAAELQRYRQLPIGYQDFDNHDGVIGIAVWDPELHDARVVELQMDECDSAYCVAGWVKAILRGERQNPIEAWMDGVETMARRALGLKAGQAMCLFAPEWGGKGKMKHRVPAMLRAIARGEMKIRDFCCHATYDIDHDEGFGVGPGLAQMWRSW